MVLLPEFDERTSYQADYQWFPLLESVTWEKKADAGVERVTGLKGRWDAPHAPDIQSVGGGIGLSKEGPNYVALWQPRPSGVEEDDWSMTLTLNPKVGDVLIREEQSDDAGHAERWLIHDVTRRPFKGQFECLCDREVQNA
jgi:hypothetical protein